MAGLSRCGRQAARARCRQRGAGRVPLAVGRAARVVVRAGTHDGGAGVAPAPRQALASASLSRVTLFDSCLQRGGALKLVGRTGDSSIDLMSETSRAAAVTAKRIIDGATAAAEAPSVEQITQ